MVGWEKEVEVEDLAQDENHIFICESEKIPILPSLHIQCLIVQSARLQVNSVHKEAQSIQDNGIWTSE